MDAFFHLTLNGLATGMLLFLLAVGLTLIFGLMHILNFSHGALFSWGAYVGTWVYLTTGSFFLGLLGALVAGVLLGWVVERFVVRPVQGKGFAQILITLGTLLVLSEFIKVVWGPHQVSVQPPTYLSGSWEIGGVVVVKYRLFLILVGLGVFFGLKALLQRTRLGLVVRAGVQNRDMVQALGVNIGRVFLFVFVLGSALAALGGVLFAPFSGVIYAEMGIEYALYAFLVVVIGGMGSVTGSVLAALLVGLVGAYMNYLVPEAALAVNMLLMAVVLLFRPVGLFGARG